MDSDAADPNWWTSSPKRPREEDDEVLKFPLRQEVSAADLEYSTEVAALMAHHHPSEHPTETSQSKKKKRKIVADQQVYQEEVMTSSSNNGNNGNFTNTNAPTDEITQVHVNVATTTVPSSSSSLPLPRVEHPPAETNTQSCVHHFLEYTGWSLFTNRHAAAGQPIPIAISAPPIPCSALNPWFLSNGIPNFSKAYQPTPSSSGDAKRKLVETEALLHADAAAAYDKHSLSMLHTSKRARLTPSVQGSDVNAAGGGGGPRSTSGAVVTLVELQDEKRKQTDLETLLVSVITGSRNNITSSS